MFSIKADFKDTFGIALKRGYQDSHYSNRNKRDRAMKYPQEHPVRE